MYHSCGHGERRDAGGTDHRIDFLFLGQEQVDDLCYQHAAGGVKDECHKPQTDDQQGVQSQEIFRLHFGGDGDAQEQGHQVGQHLLRRFRQGVQYTAFPDQIAEHQKADQRHAPGRYDAGNHGDDNGEQDLGALGNFPLMIGHPDQPFLFGGQQLDHRGLHQGNQRHVGVCGNHNGTDVLGVHVVGNENGCGAVRSADDADRYCVLHVKAQQGRQTEGEEDAELGGGTEDHQLGVGQQRLKVDHGTDPNKQQQGEQLVGDARPEQHVYDTYLLGSVIDLSDGAGQGQVYQNGAEPHGQQQGWLHVLFDGKVDQTAADHPHDHLLPGNVGHI